MLPPAGTFTNVIASVSTAETRAPTIPSPACAVGFVRNTASPTFSPFTVTVCSAVVACAIKAGERVTEPRRIARSAPPTGYTRIVSVGITPPFRQRELRIGPQALQNRDQLRVARRPYVPLELHALRR